MFPLGRFLYMPLTFVGPDFAPLSPIGCKSRCTAHRRHAILLVECHPRLLPARPKRAQNDTQDLPAKKRTPCAPPLARSALMTLYELKPSVEYQLVSQVGPSHRPMFTMAVEMNGQIFEGTAPTKREAKQAGRSRCVSVTCTQTRSFSSGREIPSVFRSISRLDRS